MNGHLILLEMFVLLAALGLLLLDLWTPRAQKRQLAYVGAAAVALIFAASFLWDAGMPAQYAFSHRYVLDGFALFFKRFFLLAAFFLLLLAYEFAERFETGIVEYYAFILFALAGMMFAASAADFSMLFVSVELITVTFYLLTSFQRQNVLALEAGIKYLVLGALASAFLVYGIALIWGTTGTLIFTELRTLPAAQGQNKLFLVGLLLVVAGLGFKIAAFPFQVWAPDVYQGSPLPTTAFLAIGSKAAGFALLLRVLFNAVPHLTWQWKSVVMIMSAATILYGNLCAIPQRNLKRLLGYSSIAHAGYLLLGVVALDQAGQAAILFYLTGYLFTVVAAFTVICVALQPLGGLDADDLSGLAGLNQRSPFLAAALTLAMISLAGVPPLAGFFGKFLLLKSVVQGAAQAPSHYLLLAIALVGVVISFYYYFGVIRVIYWSKNPPDLSPITPSRPIKLALAACIAGMLYLGIFPGAPLNWALAAAATLRGS